MFTSGKHSAILADDLTGAMDTGVQALRSGNRARVCLDVSRFSEVRQGSDLVVMDTESRNVPGVRAYRLVKDALLQLDAGGVSLIYKKIDSTLRGNIGAELDAILDSGQAAAALVAPALPHNGRATTGGMHYVHGVALHLSELGNDPFSPVRQSSLAGIVAEQSSRKTGLVRLATVRLGPAAVKLAVEDLVRAGCSVLIGDAMTDDDLASLAAGSQLVIPLLGRVLLSGSAGLFEQMRLPPCDPRTEAHSPPVAETPGGDGVSRAVLCVCGSPSAASSRQVLAARDAGRVVHVRVNEEALEDSPEGSTAEVLRLSCEVSKLLASGTDVILDATSLGKRQLLERYSCDREALRRRSDLLLATLACSVARVVKSVHPAGLVILGGDTAISLCRALGAYGIEIGGEVERYVPSGRLIGGTANGIPVVTKAGGFGDDCTLIRAIEFLHGNQ